MCLQIDAPPAKSHALGLKPKSLLDRRVASQLDFTTGAQYALPGQSKAALQHARHEPRRARKARRPRHSAVGRYFPTWNRPNRLLNSQARHANLV